MNGAIKTVSVARGFGFILGDDNVDYFFHRAELRGMALEELTAGRRVRFETHMTKRGPRAGDIREE